MTRTAWVVGSGGLLGSALRRCLREDRSPPVHTGDPLPLGRRSAPVRGDLRCIDRVLLFAARVGNMGDLLGGGHRRNEQHGKRIERGNQGTRRGCSSSIGTDARLSGRVGGIALASSAGAIYAGSPEVIITEATPPAPTTAYAREKLKQEELVRSFAARSGNCTAALARISTLYGVGQSHGKKQGLLAHIARCVLRNQVVHIYVALDTIRDYIISDDAAAAMVGVLRSTGTEAPAITKIVASEQPTTISEIISVFRKVSRHPPSCHERQHAEQPVLALRAIPFRRASRTWTKAQDGPARGCC